jgi:hypothetical protein
MRLHWTPAAAADLERIGDYLRDRFTHNDPADRASPSFAGTNTVHTSGERQSYLLLPVVAS